MVATETDQSATLDRVRIFILGAGFSRHAEFPLAADLWQEIQQRSQFLWGRAAKINDDLDTYVKYKRECDGQDIAPDQIDFEDFCRFLDVEHILGLRGSDTWSVDGNEGTVVIKTLIGQILAEHTKSLAEIPTLYLDFADRLEPNDFVLTFNYDVLLERALDAVGKPYRLFPDRYESVGDLMATVDNSTREVVLLKFHGSIDWFDRAQYSEWEAEHRRLGLKEGPSHPVFCTSDNLDLTRIVDGPRFPADPLREMYRVRNFEHLYEKNLMFLATPWLLSPSTMKIVYAQKLADFWSGLGHAGVLNFGLAVIGYSLPPQDDYARQVVYGLLTNYQGQYWGRETFGMTKTPLVIVDKCESAEQIGNLKARYRFVDWDRAVFYPHGLDDHALDLVFDVANS